MAMSDIEQFRDKASGSVHGRDPRTDAPAALALEFEEPGFDMLEAAALWAERLAGPYELDELEAFEAWMAEHPAHQFAWAEMNALRQAVTPAAREAVMRDAVRAPRRQNRRRMGAIAACLGLAAIGLNAIPELALRLQADAVTARGEMEEVLLPDGSRVALGSGSALDLDFASGARDVRLLRGEAFFKVARDPAHPFTVFAGTSRARVLGTRFNVRLDENRTTVTVEEGKVRFGAVGAPAGDLILTHGQQAFVEAGATQRQPVYDAEAAFAWRGRQIIFYRAPLRDVVAEIERYRDAPVFLVGSAAGTRTVSGALNTEQPDVALEQVVKLLGLRMTRLPGGIVFIHA
jgi:transmembrane sensor